MSKRYNKEQIGEIVAKIIELNLSFVEGAKEFNIPVRHIYRYNNEIKREKAACEDAKRIGQQGAIKANGAASASEEESKARQPIETSSLPTEIQTIIVNYRQENPDHGYKRIEEYLRDRHFIKVSRKEIRKVLKAHGLEQRLDSSFDKTEQPAKGMRRFEASGPFELFQMDLSYVYISGFAVCYLVLIIDDYSRFVVGHQLVTDQKSLTMITVLNRCIERYGKPRKLLTDQGSSFYSWSFEQTLFQKYLDDMKIEHLVCDPHSPQTQGKVERMTQTIQKELFEKVRFKSYEHGQSEIDAYIHRYNYRRPHQGIGGLCPSDRLHEVAETSSEIEQSLISPSLDLSKGYLILKDSYRTLSVAFSEKTIQVFLDGKVLK